MPVCVYTITESVSASWMACPGQGPTYKQPHYGDKCSQRYASTSHYNVYNAHGGPSVLMVGRNGFSLILKGPP